MRTLAGFLGLALAAAAAAAPLDVVTVGAPAINCKFDTDCKITVNDTVDHFVLPGGAGDAFLQSRTWPVGQAGTAAAGLHAYLYRLDLRQLTGILAVPCISQFRLDFGPVSLVDYDGNGNTDQVFVITSGGLGTVGLAGADKVGDQITFSFAPAVCAGGAPGNGETTYFFGLASAQPPRAVAAEATLTLGGTMALDARAPQLAGGGGAFALAPLGRLKLGTVAVTRATGARPGARIDLYAGTDKGRSAVPRCPGLSLEVGGARLAFTAVANAKGVADLKVSLPRNLRGKAILLQAVERSSCRASRTVTAKPE